MINFKQIVASISLTAALIAILPIVNVSAAPTPATELKSTSFSSYCLDIYHGTAILGGKVRLFNCSNSSNSQHIAINISNNNSKYQEIYFRPTLCVGDKNGLAVLVHCSSTSANMSEMSLNGKGIVSFKYANGLLTASKPSTANAYPQLKFLSYSSKTTGQDWDIITVK